MIPSGPARVMSGKGIESQAVIKFVAKPMKVREQVQVSVHGSRRALRRATRQGARAQPLLKLQERRRIEQREAVESLCAHPLEQAAQCVKVLPDRARPQRQPSGQ